MPIPKLQILRYKSKTGDGYILFPPERVDKPKGAGKNDKEMVLQFAD